MIENITMYRNLNGNNKSILSFCGSANTFNSSRYIVKNDFFDINKEYLDFQTNSIVYALQPINTIVFQCLIAPVHRTRPNSSYVESSIWTLELYKGGNLVKKFEEAGDSPTIQSYTLHNIQVNNSFQFKIGGIGASNVNPYGMFWGSLILGE